jgi:hypothetical protein
MQISVYLDNEKHALEIELQAYYYSWSIKLKGSKLFHDKTL